MTVRAALFSDIPDIVEVMIDGHKRSRYAETTTFDEIEAKQLLVRCIQRHGQQNYMGSLVLVSQNKNGELKGFIIGILDQVYPCLKEFHVTDLVFIFETGADPRDAMEMVLRLIRWGERNPKVVEVMLGCTDSIIDWRRVGAMYEQAGFEPCGGLYRMEYDRAEGASQKVEGL